MLHLTFFFFIEKSNDEYYSRWAKRLADRRSRSQKKKLKNLKIKFLKILQDSQEKSLLNKIAGLQAYGNFYFSLHSWH